MSDQSSTTRWRDKAVVPSDYEPATLVKAARLARSRMVEFEWVFTADEIRDFRRAVFESGTSSVGRYRAFDSQILAAINDAIGEPDSLFSIRPPRNGHDSSQAVSCVQDGAVFRLRGHATFDIVFGFGAAGLTQQEWTKHLGPSVKQMLASSVAPLGWNLQHLGERNATPMWNALYGMPLAYGFTDVLAPPPGPVNEVSVHFHGPFSAFEGGDCRCLFTDPIARRSGVYVWTVDIEGESRPWYVGQTQRGFGQRTGEHIGAYLSGQYDAVDALALAQGQHRRRPDAGPVGVWPDTLPSFLQNAPALVANVLGLLQLVRFHVAPLNQDAFLLNRVEGAIVRWYRKQERLGAKTLLQPGLRVPAAIPGDRALRLLLSSDSKIAGIPAEIPE